jgi:hypothetical protein
MCKDPTWQPPPKKIALLFVGPPKHNLLLKVDLEEVSHNFLVTSAFCWQGIVTIGTPCLFACYWGVKQRALYLQWRFILFGPVQHETYNPKRFDLNNKRAWKPFLSHKKFLYKLSSIVATFTSLHQPNEHFNKHQLNGFVKCGVDLVELWPLLECSCSWAHDDIGPHPRNDTIICDIPYHDQRFGHCTL